MDNRTIALRAQIEKYLSDRPNQSLRSVALRSGIPYSTLWRIQQGNGTPDFNIAIAVINVVSPGAEAGNFLAAHFPEQAKITHEIYAQHRQGLASDLYREHLSRFIPNQVFSLAATRAGVTEDRVRHLYGEAGAQALDELLACEILTREADGRVKFPTGNFSISNSEDFISDFSLKIQALNRSLLGTNGAVLGTITETVNSKALEAIKAILVDAYKKINEIVLSRDSEGPLPVFAGVAMSLLDSTDFEQTKNEGLTK